LFKKIVITDALNSVAVANFFHSAAWLCAFRNKKMYNHVRDVSEGVCEFDGKKISESAANGGNDGYFINF
jgi:hypothetical protein